MMKHFTTEAGIAYLKLIYAFGTMSLTEAKTRIEASGKFDHFECDGTIDPLLYHLIMAQEHYRGALESWRYVEGAIIPDPQTEEQVAILQKYADDEGDVVWEDEELDLMNTIPFRFGKGWRSKYPNIDLAPPC
tara:strand:- start:2934 stop:3332 length:399 start_codon:yes stop_codon:yes gene_type:complete